MALEGTHIRIAIDVKNELGVKNIGQYVSGTIYPDSRYITGVKRSATHNLKMFDGENYVDDFQKGWHMHLLCDKIQHATMHELIPDILICDEENKEWWATITAIKTAQDISDLKHFNIQEYLPYLEYAENPNGEDIKKVREYNMAVQNLYSNKGVPSLRDYRSNLVAFGISEELSSLVIQKTLDFLQNDNIGAQIENMYEKMLSTLKQILTVKNNA